MDDTLEVFFCNSDDSHYSSSIINLCRYLAETYEEEYISTADDSGLSFSGQDFSTLNCKYDE